MPVTLNNNVTENALEGLTSEARDLIDLLNLNRGEAFDVRCDALNILRAKVRYPDDEIIHAIYMAKFGYPTDLPDLRRLRPPEGNTRPDGIESSHFERKKRGELLEVGSWGDRGESEQES